MLSKIVCLENGFTLPNLSEYRGTQNSNNTLRPIKRIFCDSQMKSNDIQHLYYK